MTPNIDWDRDPSGQFVWNTMDKDDSGDYVYFDDAQDDIKQLILALPKDNPLATTMASRWNLDF